jgi:hypothetical protein
MSISITDKIFKSLQSINNYNIPYYEFDLILSGGGFSGFYYAGTFEIIKHLKKANKIKINKIYATSAGVLASISYLCNISPKLWMESYNHAKENYKNNFHETIVNTFKMYLPNNAHELCNNKLNIIVSRLTVYGFKKEIFNKFNTFDELILIVSASLNVPFLLSTHYGGIKIGNNRYYDGLFTCNTPILYNSPYPQLVMKTHKINYPLKHIFSINDNSIELLIIRGFIETDLFLNNNTNNNNPFSWIDKHLQKKEKKDKKLYIINIITIGLYMMYCTVY